MRPAEDAAEEADEEARPKSSQKSDDGSKENVTPGKGGNLDSVDSNRDEMLMKPQIPRSDLARWWTRSQLPSPRSRSKKTMGMTNPS